MTASSLPISASLSGAESTSAADIGRQHPTSSAAPAEAGGFPQMLATQRQAQQAAHAAPSARTRDTSAARDDAADEASASQAEDAALQWIATLLPGLTPMTEARNVAGIDSKLDANPSLTGQRRSGLTLAVVGQPPANTPDAIDKAPAATADQAGILPHVLSANPGKQATASAESASPLTNPLLSPLANAEAPQPRIADRFTLQRSNLPTDNTQARTGDNIASAPALATTNPAIGAQDDASVSFQQASTLVSIDNSAHGIAQLAAAGASAPTAAQPGNPLSTPLGASPSPFFVPTPVGQPGWGQAMAQQVAYALNGTHGVRQAEMRLDPPDLGPLRVTLQIQDNIAHAWFVSPHASVRHAVETALPQLAQQLADAGLSLGNTHVGSEQAGNQAFEQALSHQRQTHPGGSADHSISGVDIATPASSPVASHLLVDTYA